MRELRMTELEQVYREDGERLWRSRAPSRDNRLRREEHLGDAPSRIQVQLDDATVDAIPRNVQGVDMIQDQQWPVARLIPVSSASGVEAQERRLASALLAVMYAVPEFARALLKPLGAPAGRLDAYVEVPFRVGERTIRPDGVLTVARGTKSWTAVVETKTAANPLQADQMNIYLDLARELEFDAVLSISNQYVSSSTGYPIEVDRRKLKRVSLHHWSWVDVLTEAIVQKEHRGIKDPDQAYILNELIRYLSDPRSGAVAFEGMGPSWTAVRDGARGGTLRKSDKAPDAVAARWDDLVRYLALTLTSDLGREVRQALPPTQRTPAARRQALVDALVAKGQLSAELHIPDTAGPLLLLADLRTRQVTASTIIEAPKEGTPKGRVSWLLRQLQKAPDGVVVEARAARWSDSAAGQLVRARQEPALLHPEGKKDIRAFRLSLTGNMGLKRDSGQGSFVESVTATAQTFYGDVLQNLRLWKASPPKLKKAAQSETDSTEAVAELVGVEPEDIAAGAVPEDLSAGTVVETVRQENRQ